MTAHLTPPSGISDAIYKVGVYTVTSGNQIIAVLGQSADSAEISAEGTYSFDLRAEGSDDELGISLAGDERIAILVRRVGAGNTADTGLRHGSESANSPNVSYPDAEIDFDNVNHVIYRHENPAAGNDTHSHGTDIRGNLRIFYTVTIDHGSLVGSGNVNAGHIDSESAADGHVLTADGSGGSAWEASAGGGGGTDDQTAAEVAVDTTAFSRNLTSSDDTVQAALETIDGFTQYQGTWQQASWPAGVIVRRSGIAYISLVNNNTEIPTPSATQWSGLTEGFTYRGEAPIVATNYNYGHVVLEPVTDVYYFFASTISASVARADIATHTNFHVIGGETGHSPRVGSGNAFPTAPAPRASDIFFFDADVASGLDWKDTDGTTDLTAATGGDMARYDGTDWIKVINLVGGGGGTTDRIVLADAVGVSNTAGPHEIALTEAMVARQWLTFFVFTTTGASPDGIGYLLSDDILALTAEATAPTDAENSLPVVTASYSASNFTQQSGNYFVFRKDDSTLWVRPTRLAAHSLTITATPMGGGGSGGQQSPQAAGANAPNGLVRERVYQAVSSGVGLPLDPPAIWNTTDAEFEDDFSPWSRTQPTLGANEILAVADGFSILDDQDVRQNGSWSKFFSLTEQYCSIIQDNSTYTLDSTVAGLRFVRSLLANGWGAWKPIENGNDGWVEIFSGIPAYSANFNNIDGDLITPIDCTYFTEIEFDFWTHGMADGSNPGGRGQWHYRRIEGNWSDRLEASTNHTGLGSFKLRYYDEWGLEGVAALSDSLNDDFIGNISAGTGNPVRRYSFLFHLNIDAATTPNLISGYQIGPFSGADQYSTVNVRMR